MPCPHPEQANAQARPLIGCVEWLQTDIKAAVTYDSKDKYGHTDGKDGKRQKAPVTEQPVALQLKFFL